jgi:GNAT superfamily N-acetyltransferase
MIQQEDIIIRRIQPGDLNGAMRLSTDQGWNQTETDWRLIIENPQNSCLLAEYHGKIIGTTAAMNYSNDVAWINMVLVDKEFRGHGISKSLLEKIFTELRHCKSIKLDATPEGKQVYKQFNFIDEYSISRMTIDSIKNPSLYPDDELTEPITLNDLSAIIAYDEQVFGANRATLLEALVTEYPQEAWMLKRNHSLAGFALGRAGRRYQQIGPVMASTYTDAQILIAKSLRESEHKPIVVDVLNDKEDLINWLSTIGFVEQRKFVRMYRGINPFRGNRDKQYLICGPEFG